jgi:alpha-ketoglutarate-dependent taurine dioxygenase
VSYLSGHNDIVFGVTVSGRPAELTDVETMVGLFINILPLRLKIRSEDILLDWLKAAQETHVEVRQYEYSPLAQVQRWANGMRAQPLFESILTFQNYPVDASIAEHSKALRINDVSHHSRTNYPLTIIISSGAELSLKAIYNKRRFTADTISRILGQFSALLQHFCVEPDTRLGNLRETLDRSLKSQMLAQREKYEATARSRFKSLKPKSVTLPESDLVETCTLDKSLTMPIVFKPVVSGLDLIDWVKGHRRQVEADLLKFGAALFRGFDIKSIKRFEQFASIVCGELFNEYGDLPREGAGGNVYSSTPYPSNKAILLHNESSHLHCWPLKIAFMSLVVAQHGGETPLADCREIYRTINPKLRNRLLRKKVMYVRNYIEGVDVSWRKFFRTSRKSDVEEYCQASSINYQWKSGDRLKTSKVRPAVSKHPRTNEMVFFNQLQLHHISCLDAQARGALLATFSEEDLPRNVYYGDGSPIEDSVIQEISELTRQSTISFPWQEGDVLILDNMLVAHGRNPYIGPRKIVVAMGTMIQEGGS